MKGQFLCIRRDSGLPCPYECKGTDLVLSFSCPMFFVSGTDTGVGKTVVTALIALKLRQLGLSVGVCKPFASGCIERDGALQSEDALYLKSVLGLEDSLAQINPITLREPLAPLVAARRAGVSTASWRDSSHAAIAALKARYDVVLVEGVGGLEVPIGEDPNGIWTARDFANDLDCPIVLVARRALGTLNHTLLSVKAAPDVKALVFNDAALLEADDVAASTNVELLRAMTGLPVWAQVPFVGAARDDAAFLSAIAAQFDLDSIKVQRLLHPDSPIDNRPHNKLWV